MITSFLKAKTSKSRQVNQVTLEEFEGTVYVIGDVHGCLDHLISLEEKIFKDADTEVGQKLLVYIGDTVDRGPNSFGVIEHLLSPAPSGFERICLKGNHEQMMQRFLQKPGSAMEWLDFGGRETLLSYGAQSRDLFFNEPTIPRKFKTLLKRIIPDEHLLFLSEMPHAISLKKYFIAHAGVNPNLPLSRQSIRDLLWGAPDFLGAQLSYSKTIVHGHFVRAQPGFADGKISIDTGAYASGRISAAKLTNDRDVEFITFEGKHV